METIKLYIHGQYIDATSGECFANHNPATGEILQQVQIANETDVDNAVKSSLEGYKKWRQKTGLERGRILKRVEEILRQRNDELAKLETLDSGKPIQESLTVDIHWAADCFEYYAGVAPTIGGQYMDYHNHFAITRREPLGVCAAIGAWNYPIQVAAWKIAPALACGNSVIYKPAESTPITSTLLGEILTEAGVPDGVLNIVNGMGETGAMLSRHEKISKVSLTGEVETGRLVMRDAASTLKTVTMELGGKSPLIVFPDANLRNAVSAAMMGNFFTQGEVCTNCTRVFVHRNLYHDFVAQIGERTKKLIVGNPLDDKTQVGALINQQHQQKVLAYIEQAKQEGASVLCGGGVPSHTDVNGAFVEPTIFIDCNDSMTIVKEEIFGPVMAILVFDDEQEVIMRANNTIYGLAAGVFSQDIERANRVANALEAGMCWINSYGTYEMSMPAGGFKQSGIGTENGLETIKQYTQIKTVYTQMGDFECPFE